MRFFAYPLPSFVANASALYSNALVTEFVTKWRTALIGVKRFAASKREMRVGPAEEEEEEENPKALRRGMLLRKRVKVHREKAVCSREVPSRIRMC